MNLNTLTCSNCGTQNFPSNRLCKNCESELQRTVPDSSTPVIEAALPYEPQAETLSPRRIRIATILALGAFLIPITYVATSKVRENAESRLKLEQLVTCEWNKQQLLLGELDKRRKRAADDRAFAYLLYQGDPYRLDRYLYDLEKKREREADEEYEARSKMCSSIEK